jgi:hypothetical protein
MVFADVEEVHRAYETARGAAGEVQVRIREHVRSGDARRRQRSSTTTVGVRSVEILPNGLSFDADQRRT